MYKFLFKIKIFLAIFLAVILFYEGQNIAFSQEENCENVVLTVIARNSYGDFIPNISFSVHEQIEDVDGNSKPGTQVASGKTDAILGKGVVSFTPEHGYYVLKMWYINKEGAKYYFYDDLYLSCGEEAEVTEVLSGIKVIFRDAEEELIKNTAFSIYSQQFDTDDNPIKEKQDLIITSNTSEEGEVVIYVPSEDSNIDNSGGGYYVLEIKNKDGHIFTLYDINVYGGSTKKIDYMFSQIELILSDSKDALFPANTKVEIFKQAYDVDDEAILGDKVKDIYTDDIGTTILESPEGFYVARVEGANKQYQYFWELEVEDQEKNTYYLNTSSSWVPGDAACEAESTFTLITRDIAGDNIPNLKYELYLQTEDVDGVTKADTKIINSTVDEFGKGISVFNPDPRHEYALKIYDVNSNVGDFWYFNQLQFFCGEDIEITKNLPAINFVLRNGEGELLKNQKFSLYTQKFDIDGQPIKEKKDLVSSSLVTSAQGIKTIYVAPDHPFNKEKRGTYVFESVVSDSSEKFIEYDIEIPFSEDVLFEYIFSDLNLELKDASGYVYSNKVIDIYKQGRNLNGEYVLEKKIKSIKTDSSGIANIVHPAGYYAVAIKDGLGKNNIFWSTQIKNRVSNKKTLTLNLTRIRANDVEGNPQAAGASITIYTLKEEGEEGVFYKDKKKKTIKMTQAGFAEISLAPEPYLFVNVSDKIEYGRAIYTENNKLQEVVINQSDNYKILSNHKFYLEAPLSSGLLAERLSGKILLQVEARGEAWYVDPKTLKRYYMKDGNTAYAMMRNFGLGITNEDLEKIPIGIDDRFEEYDYDGDTVFDKMEEAIGTDMYLMDSDEDGYKDGEEVINDYNPMGQGRLPIDNVLAKRLKGKILLQVESRGEAWYVNPDDNRRYYMPDGESAYEIMRFLSLGITNEDLEQIETGVINIE